MPIKNLLTIEIIQQQFFDTVKPTTKGESHVR